MAKPTFSFYIDTADDGSYAANISSVVIEAAWQIGFAEPFELMARDSTATMLVNNVTKDFSPEYASGAYYGNLQPGRAVKITSTYASVTRTMYVGWIAMVTPTFNSKGDRTASIECNGWFERAQRFESRIPLQIAKRSDEVIAAILDSSDILPPGFTGFWILGKGLLGTSTLLSSVDSYFTFDNGDVTFAYAGDWDAGTTVHDAITQTVGREAGRFFQKRDGTLQFYRRLHFPTSTTVAATFSDGMTALDYSYGAELSNVVVTHYEPRSVGTAGTVLATFAAEVLAPAASYVDVILDFTTQDAGATIAATTLITPLANTDYTANSLADGSGTNLTANVTASITVTNASSATIRYTNSGVDAYLLATSQLRGTPLTKFNTQDYIATNETSLLAYGKLAFDVAGVQDTLADATSLGDYQLSLRKDPVAKITTCAWAGWNTSLTAQVLTRTIGDRITLHETQTAANGDWFILGERHTVSANDYQCAWVLENAGTIIYWILGTAGYGELGTTTTLGPL